MRRPWSGRFDNVSRRSDISTPGPRTRRASPRRPYVAALRASSPSGALTRCWPGWPGLRISAAGVSGLRPVWSIARRKVKQAGATSVAIANDVRVSDRLDRLQCGQARMAWSHADEPDPAHATTNAHPTPGHGETD